MKTKSGIITAVAVTMALLCSGMAYAYDPVASQSDCPDGTLTNPTAIIDPTPAEGAVDFCAVLDLVYCSVAPIMNIVNNKGEKEEEEPSEIQQFVELVRCETVDINGPVDVEAEIPVSPNGILDGQFELALLALVLNDTTFNLNGLTHDAAWTAFETTHGNLEDLVWDILGAINDGQYEGVVRGLAPHLPSLISYMLSGYVCLGDSSFFETIEGLLQLIDPDDLGDFEIPDLDDIFEYIPGYFAANDDMDGDGATNMQEYLAFSNNGSDPAAYLAAVINPAVYPETTVVQNGFKLTGPYWVEEGDRAMLSFPSGLNYTGALTQTQWSKDGSELSGENALTLTFPAVTLEDAGSYQLTIADESKGLFTSSPFVLNVIPEGGVPVAGGLGLGILASICALGGATVIRRKR